MLEISKEYKKINFWQKWRIDRFKQKIKKRKFKFEDYENAPYYIKNSSQIVKSLYDRKDKLGITNEQLRKIEPALILKFAQYDNEFMNNYSIDEKYNFLLQNLLTQISDNELVLMRNKPEFNSILKNSEFISDTLMDILLTMPNNEKILPELTKRKEFREFEIKIERYPKAIQYLDEKKQIEIFTFKPYLLGKVSLEIQKKILEQDKKFYQYVDIEVKKSYIKKDIKNFYDLTTEEKAELINLDTRLFQILSLEEKRELMMMPDIFNKLVKEDINNIKYFSPIKEINYGIFDGIEKLDISQIKELILHSKQLSAKGSLMPFYYMIHGLSDGGGSSVLTFEEFYQGNYHAYNPKQIELLQNLTIDQIVALIQIDVNYSLVYLTDKNAIIMSGEQLEKSKKKCYKIFEKIYGKAKQEEYVEIIDFIYELENKYYEANENFDIKLDATREETKKFAEYGNRPLDELKILFNSHIINTSSKEEILKYLQDKQNGNDGYQYFMQIIERAYGKEAGNILKHRKKLNVHTINSLEILSEEIFNEFGEAFVNDCITYNIKDFSEFLEIMKTPEKKELFKKYYTMVADAMGNNVEVMQKCITEFSFNEEILKNTKNKKLSEKQKNALMNTLLSSSNPYNITTIEQLENYDSILDNELKKTLMFWDRKNKKDVNSAKELREVIVENLLGMSYDSLINESFNSITSLYDFENVLKNPEKYTEEERKIARIFCFIQNDNEEKIRQVCENGGLKRKFYQNQKLIQKIRRLQKVELKEKLLTKDKVMELAKGKTEKDEIFYKKYMGIDTYHLNGIELSFFSHKIFSKNLQVLSDFFDYESQAGSTAISARYINNQTWKMLENTFIFSDLQDNEIIGSHTSDANTTHISKMVRNRALKNIKVRKITGIFTAGNEVSFYRNLRNHSRISTRNKGGRVIPDAYCIYEEGLEELSERKIEILKKNQVPIYVLHTDKYEEKEIEEMKEK